MKLLKNILLGLLLSAAPMGHLAAGETKSVEVEENDIDSEITNEKLRADSGSKNRISSVSYTHLTLPTICSV